ncbi:ATP phosphoribosyltransferase regulatory subunit [Marinobacterium nitratireducens]|uniref:ATP phosphoribosyltransferase regulatory subunit n=1 Tax=Marinobacterium nitratireducens TaxID=518897 RepID=A0A917ZN00_9GAMM|nr:ATP phosphoribosyltransferase regulatory subunit [Marinobacterium nitratireducens]GGO86013.1 ATP phosphoribosyltransferase regulatory subunit [Marinobacterium nitratireducens]
MALADRWLLPDGVKDILPPRAHQIEALRRRLLDLYDSWGYELVMPPLMEHLESLLTGVGRDLDLDTYKLTDQVSGHLLGIRADITPQVARIDAHRMRNKGASRFCYCGSVLHTRPANMLASRNPLQVGAELYGHAGLDSDVEVISLMLETLLASGIEAPLSLDLGHVGIFRNLMADAGLTAAEETEYLEKLQLKALPEIEVFLNELEADARLLDRLAELPRLHGGADVLARARSLFADASPAVNEAIDYLEKIAEQLAQRFPGVRQYFDLGELRGYNYHTGIVFAAYADGFGQAIAKGGRYDEIGRDFGLARPATGFSSDLKTLADLSAGPLDSRGGAILAPAGQESVLIEQINKLRAQGERVIQQLPDVTLANLASCDRRLLRQGEDWVLEAL